MILMVGVTGRVIARYGVKVPMVAGLALLAAGIALLGRAPVGGSYVTDVLGPTLIAAVGMSLTFIPTLMAALSHARPEEGGLASGLINTTYQVGSALGLAVASAVAISATDGSGIQAAQRRLQRRLLYSSSCRTRGCWPRVREAAVAFRAGRGGNPR